MTRSVYKVSHESCILFEFGGGQDSRASGLEKLVMSWVLLMAERCEMDSRRAWQAWSSSV